MNPDKNIPEPEEEEIARALKKFFDGRPHRFRAALIDMDGTLYDSMPIHARAWKEMFEKLGINLPYEEFFNYEGMTGRQTIRYILRRERGTEPSDEECDRLYAIKAEKFRSVPLPPVMPGAKEMLEGFEKAGLDRVLVTGSGQFSLIDRINHDFPGAFSLDTLVTSRDVTKGKPDPEPYIRGAEKAGARPEECIAVDNAPLGIESGHRSGCFTVGVATGPIPLEELIAAGADIVFPSVKSFAEKFPMLNSYTR